MGLTRVSGDGVSHAMFIRPRRPDDHAQFEWLLPQCMPLFIYADERGRDWVRWSLPKTVALKLGWDMGCECCGNTEQATHEPDNAYIIDTAWDETSWFLEKQDA